MGGALDALHGQREILQLLDIEVPLVGLERQVVHQRAQQLDGVGADVARLLPDPGGPHVGHLAHLANAPPRRHRDCPVRC